VKIKSDDVFSIEMDRVTTSKQCNEDDPVGILT